MNLCWTPPSLKFMSGAPGVARPEHGTKMQCLFIWNYTRRESWVASRQKQLLQDANYFNHKIGLCSVLFKIVGTYLLMTSSISFVRLLSHLTCMTDVPRMQNKSLIGSFVNFLYRRTFNIS